MAKLSRKDLEIRYEMFDKFALVDQKAYYFRTIEKYDESAGQVNSIRAGVSLFTGAAAAVAGLIVGIYFTSSAPCALDANANVGFFSCTVLSVIVDLAVLLSVALPALNGFFGTLADLYQWDKQISIYKAAAESIEVADAHSPDEEMDDITYRASLVAYSQGTLQVMSDETAQWGQSIRTPKGLDAYVEDARKRAAEFGGDANAGREKEPDSPVMKTDLPDKPVTPKTSDTDAGGENSAG